VGAAQADLLTCDHARHSTVSPRWIGRSNIRNHAGDEIGAHVLKAEADAHAERAEYQRQLADLEAGRGEPPSSPMNRMT